MRRLTGLLVALLLLIATAAAQAVPPDQRGEAFNRLEKKVMCIQCNVPLNIAEAAQADATRDQIRLLLDRGLSEEQVLDQLVEDYGTTNILASPKAEGINALAYVVPVAALAALLLVGALLLPRWRRGRDSSGPPDRGTPAGGPSRAERDRLDADLARYGT